MTPVTLPIVGPANDDLRPALMRLRDERDRARWARDDARAWLLRARSLAEQVRGLSAQRDEENEAIVERAACRYHEAELALVEAQRVYGGAASGRARREGK